MPNEHTTQCEHEDCVCEVTSPMRGAAYCSDYCEARDTNDEQMEMGCSCGHPGCDTP